jgi:hypothetical protein
MNNFLQFLSLLLLAVLFIWLTTGCEHVSVERNDMRASYTAFAANARTVTWTPDSLVIEDRDHASPAVAVVRTVSAAALIKAGIDAVQDIATTGITE